MVALTPRRARSNFLFRPLLQIVKINIFQDRYVVASTTETLLLGDLETFKLSEIPWQSHGATEKFIFDNPVAALVFAAGELSVVEYGHNEILGAVRTDYISGHLLSMVLNERSARGEGAEEHGCKKVAYLLDLQTINVKDLVSQASNPISHDAKVDWLELNGRGNLLLFRDKQRQLHLFNLDTQIRSTLLNYCTYVQWVPDSDVVVAQNRTQLCVWYNIHAPDQVSCKAPAACPHPFLTSLCPTPRADDESRDQG
jgi:intraflagellar transport protein 172